MLTTDDLRRLEDERKVAVDNGVQQLINVQDSAQKMAEEFENVVDIMGNLDKEFSKKTAIINPKDMSLLFVATGLLCAKWVIMGQMCPLDFDFKYEPTPKEERMTDKEGDELAEEKRKKNNKYRNMKNENDDSDEGYRTVNQIIFRPVPYDALNKVTEKNLSELINIKNAININNVGGRNHRAYTLGHDPVLGWIFGTINIMTRTITLKNMTLDTYLVTEKGNKIIRHPKSNIFSAIYHAFMSTREDNKRLPAAVFKQSLHFLSDKYTKQGLPIPLINAEKAQELIEKGWNSVEVSRAIKKFMKKTVKLTGTVLLQYTISFLINLIIKAIHLMLYDEAEDGTFEMYEVRTRKILKTANVISSSSNILVSAGIAMGTKNIANGAKRLDIGGMIETINRLISDTKFINDIKQEYIVNRFEEIVIEDKEQNLDDLIIGTGGDTIMLNKNYEKGASDIGKVAAKAFNNIASKVNDATKKIKQGNELQGKINNGVFNILDAHGKKIQDIQLGTTPIDMKTIYNFTPEEKSIMCTLFLRLSNAETQEYIAELCGFLSGNLLPESNEIPSLEGDAAKATAHFLYQINELSDKVDIHQNIECALNTLTLSGNDKISIDNQTQRIKKQLGDYFRLYLFAEIEGIKQQTERERRIAAIPYEIRAVVAGKSCVGKYSLINRIFEFKNSSSDIGKSLTESIKVYSDKSNKVKLYLTKGITMDNMNVISDQICDVVTQTKANLLLYCVSLQSNRFEEYEEELINRIRNQCKNLKVLIVLTNCYNTKDAAKMTEKIKERTNRADVCHVLLNDYETDVGTVPAFGVDLLIEEMQK